MALHRIDSRDPRARDPFFEPLRRRHPDVDLVLLPPVAATAPPARHAAPEPAAEATVAEAWAGIRSAAAALAAWLPGAEPEVGWHSGGAVGTVRPTAVASATLDDGADVVDRLADAVAAAGWTATRRPHRLVARSGDLTLTVTFAPSTRLLLARVTGRVLHVGPVRAAALVGEG